MSATDSLAIAPPKLTDAKGYAHPALGAFKALAEGKARPDQQITALAFLIEDISRAYDISYRPDAAGGDRDTAFAEGRRFVGLQVRRIIMQPMEKLTGERKARAAKPKE